MSDPRCMQVEVNLDRTSPYIHGARDLIELVQRATWGDEACKQWLMTRCRYGASPGDVLRGAHESLVLVPQEPEAA